MIFIFFYFAIGALLATAMIWSDRDTTSQDVILCFLLWPAIVFTCVLIEIAEYIDKRNMFKRK